MIHPKRLVALLALGVGVVVPTVDAQVPAGGEFLVNTYTTNVQDAPRVAMGRDGDFVVVWESIQGGVDYDIFGQRFTAAGVRRGAEFAINTYTTGQQRRPAVSVGPRGEFMVVWSSVQDGSDTSVHGRRYDASGSALGAELQLNIFTTGFQLTPRVSHAGDGRFVVTWSISGFSGSYDGIAARRFDAAGNSIGGEFLVNTYTAGTPRDNDVSVAPDGSFVVVWDDASNRDGSGGAVLGQRYDAAGARLGTEFQVNTYTTGDQFLPSVSASALGFVVAWTTPSGGLNREVRSRRFDAAGNALGSDFVVNAYTTGVQSGGRVAQDGRGGFVATWTSESQDGSGDGAFGQRFDGSGARRGAEFQVNTYTTTIQRNPAVASDAVGNFVVAWESRYQDGSNYGVFAQRFGGLEPAALAVDATGNAVLEPGETVAVRPSWRNVNGAAQTFSGTLTNIAGPAGATYAITDGTGDYGTVANGATGPCTDCYAVSVSNPTARPAVHWDASAVESILPDTQGQQKEWRLHIGRSFTDVSTTNPFYRFIETLLHHGVTTGCGATTYCPAASTAREQMAVFMLIAREGAQYLPPACTTPLFADVPASSPFCRWIEELARRGVVGGCGGGNYCPSSPVTREQMAVFVLLTLDPTSNPPPCVPPNMFDDVPETSPFCRWIEELARRGVIGGCGGNLYCPLGTVSREQMSVFVAATLGLTLYGP